MYDRICAANTFRALWRATLALFGPAVLKACVADAECIKKTIDPPTPPASSV